MKNFLLCIVLAFLIVSCSSESDFSVSEKSNSEGVGLKFNSKIPENKVNFYDAKGKEYYALVTNYLKNNAVPNSIPDTADQLQFLFKNYSGSSLTGQSDVSISLEQFTLIMNDPENHLKEIVENCPLGAEAKLNLFSFIKTLISQQGKDYTEVYNSIVSYEASIIASTTLGEDEKETILTLSSISRYTLFAESELEHRDRDWEISVGNRKDQKDYNGYRASIVSMMLLFNNLV